MSAYPQLDQIAINVKAHKLLKKLLKENPKLDEVMHKARNETEALIGVRNWLLGDLKDRPHVYRFYKYEVHGREAFEKLTWKDFAIIRILDYIDNAGKEYEDMNLRGEIAVSNPIKMIWLAVIHGTGGAKPAFFKDMLYLFRQYRGEFLCDYPTKEKIEEWMDRFSSGLDPRIVRLREENRDRIINIIIDKIDKGEITDSKYHFYEKMSKKQKFLKMLE